MADIYPAAIAPGQTMLDEKLGATDEAHQIYLRKCADMDGERTSLYALAEMYYDGTQVSYVTDRLRTYLEASGLSYVENYCETVVDALVERLAVIGFVTGDDGLDEWLWSTFWDKNRGDELQLDVHEMAVKKGDAFVILEWDDEVGRVCAYLNPPEHVRPMYHEGELVWVAKVWNTNDMSPTNPTGLDVRRMNLYYPDRVEKWFALAKSSAKTMWARWMDDSDKTWPIDWTHNGKPLGIPVIHFANKARRNRFGRPEHLGTIPQQDRLNKELLDLSAVLDQLGWPQRYVTGMANTENLKNVPGEVWQTDATDGSFGQFEAANPEGLLRAIQTTLVRIATRSNTPAHRFTLEGGYPSGEALKVAEAGLVAKTRSRQIKWGGAWAELALRATTMAIIRAEGSGLGPGVTLDQLDQLSVNTTWADPETRNEKEHLETLGLMHALGVSKSTILAMMPGIDPAMEEKLRAKEDDEGAARSASIMDAGVVAPPLNGSTRPLSIAAAADDG